MTARNPGAPPTWAAAGRTGPGPPSPRASRARRMGSRKVEKNMPLELPSRPKLYVRHTSGRTHCPPRARAVPTQPVVPVAVRPAPPAAACVRPSQHPTCTDMHGRAGTRASLARRRASSQQLRDGQLGRAGRGWSLVGGPLLPALSLHPEPLPCPARWVAPAGSRRSSAWPAPPGAGQCHVHSPTRPSPCVLY